MSTWVRPETKKAYELMHDISHKYYKGETLYECYGRPSLAKIKSWEKIKEDCNYLNGEHLHVTGAGSHMYSCIYAYPIVNHKTGEVISMIIRKETSKNTYELELPINEYKCLMQEV